MKRTTTIRSLLLLAMLSGFAQQRTDSVHVAHYDLHLSVVDFTNHVIDGYTDITVVSKVNNLTQVRQKTDFVVFRKVDVGIGDVEIFDVVENGHCALRYPGRLYGKCGFAKLLQSFSFRSEFEGFLSTGG